MKGRFVHCSVTVSPHSSASRVIAAVDDTGRIWLREGIGKWVLIESPDEVTTTVRDPHHNSTIEWKLDSGQYYQRLVGTKRWASVKRIHATPARIAALAALTESTCGL